MNTLSASSLHREIAVQEHFVEQLVAHQGYRERRPEHHDKPLALDIELVVEFLQTSQPEAWAALEAQYPGSAQRTLIEHLAKMLKRTGTLDVLRQGIRLVPNIRFQLCAFKPASSINPDLVRLYEANILSVIQEVEYSTRHSNRIDTVLYVNGIPVATLEFKNTLTNTNYKAAEKQYKRDRSPVGEPLLTFQRGALVHFALDQDYVSMATRLANGQTYFLPFNRGRDGGAGNPDVTLPDGTDEFRIAYLYRDLPEGRAIFSREVLLDIIGRFIHLNDDGVMIFPRFQQLDAVRKLMTHAREHGCGQNYLIQHSAGSGKSNTIGWTAHQAVKLHTEDDRSIFDTAIILTDRRVLDRQLQKTVTELEQTPGVVRAIDGTSRQLKEALEAGAKIIVSTIQKFGTDHLAALSAQAHKRFAVIMDEAHSSQSGKAAEAVSKALTASEVEDAGGSLEDIILAQQNERGPQENISYFAFTATPRNVTLERFGHTGEDGKPHPFHLYSMRQAIEEGFILDVLKNYSTYKAYYELEKTIEDDPRFEGTKAQRKVAKFAHLNDDAIDKKVEVMVEHFRRHVMHELGGEAKAMVVTASREAALKYYRGMERYLASKNYSEMGVLVAFSGALPDGAGGEVTEPDLNGFAETELTRKFDGEGYHLLIVAEKYQTGFDQPKLCAMYVDRKLAGLQAVQTLSRLNRTKTGKDKTFILDFQNSIEDIQEAFKPFFETTTLEERSDPNQIYELEQKIIGYGFIDRAEIDRFCETYFKPEGVTTHDRPTLEAIVRNAVDRWSAEDDEGRREEFRQLLKSYQRFYVFLAQIMALEDSGLEKLYVYATWLDRKLPDREQPADPDISDDMLRLVAFKVEQKDEGSASLTAGERTELKPISEFAAKPFTEREAKTLQEIIDAFNERYGGNFSEDDYRRFVAASEKVMEDPAMLATLRNNPPDVSRGTYERAVYPEIIRAFQRDNDMKSIILTDAEARSRVFDWLFSIALRHANEGRSENRGEQP
ncbi:MULTISPECIES: type I restriction endonuclease subunit R [Alphaproteobacteria]|uniref:type I restriction endonuclease subunit R n=1 Tax=Alphaproteobacteria TaxID=28211 RepID=UPI001AFDB329|nr:type I restriction endonuclease [Maricaulis sp.]MBO6765036.1 type I restriction endonuclease subunit R [Maricaulis sp.]